VVEFALGPIAPPAPERCAWQSQSPNPVPPDSRSGLVYAVKSAQRVGGDCSEENARPKVPDEDSTLTPDSRAPSTTFLPTEAYLKEFSIRLENT